MTGVQHPRTSWRHVGDFEMPRFTSREQKKIASTLWQLSKSITANQTSLNVALALKSIVNRTLFTRGLRGESTTETDIGLVPESWRTVRLSDIATVRGGKRMPKGVALTNKYTGIPYVRVTDMANHGILTSQVLFVPAGYESKIARYTISHNDVYISIAGTIGLVGQVPRNLDGANLTENAAKICITDPHVTARFVMYALASETCQMQITRETGRNAQPKLALARIEQIELPLPATQDEQQEIVSILSIIDRKADLCRRKRTVLGTLLKSLIDKLITGGINVDDLDLPMCDYGGGTSLG